MSVLALSGAADRNALLPASYDVAGSALLALFVLVPLIAAFALGAWWERRRVARRTDRHSTR